MDDIEKIPVLVRHHSLHTNQSVLQGVRHGSRPMALQERAHKRLLEPSGCRHSDSHTLRQERRTGQPCPCQAASHNLTGYDKTLVFPISMQCGLSKGATAELRGLTLIMASTFSRKAGMPYPVNAEMHTVFSRSAASAITRRGSSTASTCASKIRRSEQAQCHGPPPPHF